MERVDTVADFQDQKLVNTATCPVQLGGSRASAVIPLDSLSREEKANLSTALGERIGARNKRADQLRKFVPPLAATAAVTALASAFMTLNPTGPHPDHVLTTLPFMVAAACGFGALVLNGGIRDLKEGIAGDRRSQQRMDGLSNP